MRRPLRQIKAMQSVVPGQEAENSFSKGGHDQWHTPMGPRQKTPKYIQTEIEYDALSTWTPIPQQSGPAFFERITRRTVVRQVGVLKNFSKLLLIPLSPTSIDHPNHVAVKFTPLMYFFLRKIRMLELDHKTGRDLYVGTMRFPIFSIYDNFLELRWEMRLPIPMPKRLRLVPVIAVFS
jgi:hypothetical protein